MKFEVFLSVSSLVYLFILMMTYYSKDMLNSTSSKFFRIMIITSLVFSILEIGTVLLIHIFGDSVKIITTILWRLHGSAGTFFVGVLYLYIICKYQGYKNESIFESCTFSLTAKIVSVVIIVYPLIALFLPYVTPTSSKMVMVDRISSIYSGIYLLLFAFCTILSILKRKNSNLQNFAKFNKVMIFVALFDLIGIAFQILFENIAFFPFICVVDLYLIYFFIENPDISIFTEISNSQNDIEKSNQAKSDFLSNMTYEIKTPMNLIISLCDELNNMPVYNKEEAKNNIKMIVDSGNNLLDIVNNILDISKIETGKETLSEKEYSINVLLEGIINVAKQKIGNKQVKLLVNIDQSTSSVLYGDSSKLNQALTNIISNAVRYTEVGRITFTLSSSKQNGSEHLLFKISDTGIGIKDEEKETIFLKDKKTEKKTSEESAGLGLVVTKQYIEAMNGKIWLESQYRVGSTFFVEVPQKIIDATPLGSTANIDINKGNEKLDCSKFKVLIVDDNLLNIKVAKRLLENYKFTVDSVTSGRECIDKIKQEEKYDGIFMDHMMPEMDGIETLHVLKRLDGYQLPPIIALTANAIAGMKEMYLNEGFDDYLAKPINTHELDRVVNKFYRK